MDMMTAADWLLLVLMICIIAFLNIFATRAALRDDLSERGQRIAQVLMVWLLPILGALLVLAVHRKPETPSGRYRPSEHDADQFGAGRLRHPIVDALDE